MAVIGESGVNRQKSGVKIRTIFTPILVHFGRLCGNPKFAIGGKQKQLFLATGFHESWVWVFVNAQGVKNHGVGERFQKTWAQQSYIIVIDCWMRTWWHLQPFMYAWSFFSIRFMGIGTIAFKGASNGKGTDRIFSNPLMVVQHLNAWGFISFRTDG